MADKSGAARTGKGLKRDQLDTATTSETRADGATRNVRRLVSGR